VRGLALAVVVVVGADHRHAGRAPGFGEPVGVVDVDVERTRAGGWLLAVCEMDRQLVAVREGVVLVVMGDREAEQLVVADRSRDVGDFEAGSWPTTRTARPALSLATVLVLRRSGSEGLLARFELAHLDRFAVAEADHGRGFVRPVRSVDCLGDRDEDILTRID
jgi:hypothetical protein